MFTAVVNNLNNVIEKMSNRQDVQVNYHDEVNPRVMCQTVCTTEVVVWSRTTFNVLRDLMMGAMNTTIGSEREGVDLKMESGDEAFRMTLTYHDTEYDDEEDEWWDWKYIIKIQWNY